MSALFEGRLKEANTHGMAAATPEKKETVWQRLLASGFSPSIILLITDEAHHLGEKATVIPKMLNMLGPRIPTTAQTPCVVASGESVQDALGGLGGSEEAVVALVVSPHAKDAAATLAFIDHRWGSGSVSPGSETYCCIVVSHTCGQKLGESCRNCAKALSVGSLA